MIHNLALTGVGPSGEMTADFAERLNLLTGDNGLGKSFLLDIAWWALTRKWPAEINPKLPGGLMARPQSGAKRTSIAFSVGAKTKKVEYKSVFDRETQAWSGRAGRPLNPGLVIYAQVDGSFAVWDPARNYWRKKGNIDVQDRPPAYVFSPKEVWEGLVDPGRGLLCNGLVSDWAGWQKENGTAFKSLQSVLEKMSPSPDEPIIPGEPMRISLDYPKDVPTIRMSYGQSVPVLYASAGIRRILALAYLLVWCWEEHQKACVILGDAPTRQVVFLIDEIEAHLHPKWQRRIVASLLHVMASLAENAAVQVIAATHSPLVMASVEPLFDVRKDAWFDLDLVAGKADRPGRVTLLKRDFRRLGDAGQWLVGDAFDLKSARSLEAETALARVEQAMGNASFGKREAKTLDGELRKVLGETDPAWMRWRYIAEKKGWLS